MSTEEKEAPLELPSQEEVLGTHYQEYADLKDLKLKAVNVGALARMIHNACMQAYDQYDMHPAEVELAIAAAQISVHDAMVKDAVRGALDSLVDYVMNPEKKESAPDA